MVCTRQNIKSSDERESSDKDLENEDRNPESVDLRRHPMVCITVLQGYSWEVSKVMCDDILDSTLPLILLLSTLTKLRSRWPSRPGPSY